MMESKKDLPGLVGRMCFLPKFKHNKWLTLLPGSFNHHFYQKPWQTLLCWNFYHFNHDTDGEPANNNHSSNSNLTVLANFLQAGVQFSKFQIQPPKYKKPPQCWFLQFCCQTYTLVRIFSKPQRWHWRTKKQIWGRTIIMKFYSVRAVVIYHLNPLCWCFSCFFIPKEIDRLPPGWKYE